MPIINKTGRGNIYNIGDRLSDLLLRLDTKRALKVNRVFLLTLGTDKMKKRAAVIDV